jgi:hypothetical protein
MHVHFFLLRSHVLTDEIRVLPQSIKTISDRWIRMVGQQFAKRPKPHHQCKRIVTTEKQARPVITELNRARLNSGHVRRRRQHLDILGA